MRKLRKTGAVDADGNVVALPRLPSVTGSHKPPGWNRWSVAEKVEHLLGMSLDRMHDFTFLGPPWPRPVPACSAGHPRRCDGRGQGWGRGAPRAREPVLARWRGISGIPDKA
jgi:hypothetical protein